MDRYPGNGGYPGGKGAAYPHRRPVPPRRGDHELGAVVFAAASVGIKVKKIRYIAVLTSGFLGGLAGGCLVLTQTIQFTSTTINGTGFIALAAVSFGRWRPAGISLSSLLFGAAVAFSIYVVNIPSLKNLLPSEFFSLLPYVITIVALVVFSGKNYAPLAAGKPYDKGSS